MEFKYDGMNITMEQLPLIDEEAAVWLDERLGADDMVVCSIRFADGDLGSPRLVAECSDCNLERQENDMDCARHSKKCACLVYHRSYPEVGWVRLGAARAAR